MTDHHDDPQQATRAPAPTPIYEFDMEANVGGKDVHFWVFVTDVHPGDPGAPASYNRNSGDLTDPGNPGEPPTIQWVIVDDDGYVSALNNGLSKRLEADIEERAWEIIQEAAQDEE